MYNKAKSKPKEIVLNEKRGSCPFYGFTGTADGIFDTCGNGCALKGGHSPCDMEMSGQKPIWPGCPYQDTDQNRLIINDLASTFHIYPEEFRPEDGGDWEPVILGDWMAAFKKKRSAQ